MSHPPDHLDRTSSAARPLEAPSSLTMADTLRVCEARFRILFEQAQLGIVLADADSFYLDANPRACEMLGYTRDEFIGLHASDIVTASEGQHVRSALNEIHDQSHHRREWQFRRKDGSVFPADVVATAMPDGTLVGMIRDLSDEQRVHDYREHLAAIVESSLDAIVGKDLNGVVTSWNSGATEMFGYTAAEMIGTPITRVIPEDRRDEEAAILQRLRQGARVEQLETVRWTKAGRTIDVSVTVSPIRDISGRIVGASKIVRDITVLKERQREIDRLSRLYAALSQVNQAIVWSPSRDELMPAVCRALVERGGFKMAWIGWFDPESRRLVPIAECGDENGYLQRIDVYGDDRPEGRGPSGTAFRSGQPYISNELLDDPATLPWRGELERRGFGASAVFPIRLNDRVCATLSVYADRAGFFHDKEVALLEEAATDISFALDNFARNEARRRAEQAVLNEKRFSDAMIESMPGVLYFYDASGRFLRWNRNFELVSGYSGDEIARMHPRQFFDGEDVTRVEQRIAEVLERGESSIEAAFVAKDGTRTPYFFTGRRVQFEEMTCLVGVGIDISDRLLAEDRLADSERKYRELVQHANSIILCWNAAGRVTFLNEFGQRFFGYAAEEIIGRHVTGTIVPPTESGGRDLRLLVADIIAAPEAYEQNVNENMRRNGERVWISWTNRIVRDAQGRVVEFLSIGNDITGSRKTEAKLREREADLIEAQRIGKIGSWKLDIRSRHLTWSEQTADIFGMLHAQSEQTYDAFVAFVHPLDRARVERAVLAAISGESQFDVEHRIVLPDGREKVVHQRADLHRDADGSPTVLAGTIHDITDRVRVEVEREKRHQAEAADRIKSAFLATMSHELRTPLNSIIGFTGIVLQGLAGPLNAEQSKQLEMVRSSARHLLALVNDVLDISKIEAGQLDLAHERFDLRRSIARVAGLVAPQAEAKTLALHVRVAPDLAGTVGDERRFEQILLNLLSNAIKFTDQGEIVLAAEWVADYQAPGAGSGQPAVRVRVSDTGIGIKAEELPNLFQPFRQLDSGIARRHEGTGLGLAICGKLASLMSGEIGVESEWGVGSTFIVTLPLGEAVRA